MEDSKVLKEEMKMKELKIKELEVEIMGQNNTIEKQQKELSSMKGETFVIDSDELFLFIYTQLVKDN